CGARLAVGILGGVLLTPQRGLRPNMVHHVIGSGARDSRSMHCWRVELYRFARLRFIRGCAVALDMRECFTGVVEGCRTAANEALEVVRRTLVRLSLGIRGVAPLVEVARKRWVQGGDLM